MGVYQGWYMFPPKVLDAAINCFYCRNNICPFVKGISGNKFVGYATKDLAIASFTRALADNKVILVSV